MSVADYTDAFAVLMRQVQYLTSAKGGEVSLHALRRYYRDGISVE